MAARLTGVSQAGQMRKGLRSKTIQPVFPREFQESDAFKAARVSPERYPTLLLGAEWCLPLTEGPALFHAPTPNGTQLTMGRVDRLLEELSILNDRTLQLSPRDLDAARQAGPPQPASPVEDVAPFGLSVLVAVAEFASVHSVPWIMDY